MNKIKSLTIKNDKNQPIKSISYQYIYSLHDLLEQLNSWQNALNLLNDFFSDKQRPVNKKKIVSDYYACSQILTKMEQQITELRQKEDI